MNTLKHKLQESIQKSLGKSDLEAKNLVIEVDYPQDKQFGDYSTNIGLKASPALKKPPMEAAQTLVEKVKQDKELKDIFEKIEAVKPGFINFYLSPAYLNQQVNKILSLKGGYGRSNIGQGQKIQIEFISANPTGPLTIGNGRGGFYGDVLGNVMKKCGFEVVKEYLVNDAGKQIEALGHSVLKDDQAVYHGGYIDELHKEFGNIKNPYQAGQKAAAIILDKLIKKTVQEKMQIKFDVWFSEQNELRKTKKIEKLLDWLKKKKFLYEKDGAWWFKSSDYGDARDRVLIKSNGELTYLAQDFAYLKNKFSERKFDKVVNVWGADHQGDVAGLLNAAEVLGYGGKQEIVLMQFAKLIKDGREVRMSKRRGTYVTMDDLIAMVGHDAARFLFLMYTTDTHMDFDINLAREKSEKNPVYYVQYAYARLNGILRQKEIESHDKKGKFSNNGFSHLLELELIKELIKWPEILESICFDYQVQLLPRYAMNIADRFHQFYAKCRVVDNGRVNWSRVKLVRLTKKVLGEVLGVIGVSAPEKM